MYLTLGSCNEHDAEPLIKAAPSQQDFIGEDQGGRVHNAEERKGGGRQKGVNTVNDETEEGVGRREELKEAKGKERKIKS